MNKKILIAAGGTGGHIIPATGLAQELSCLIDAQSIYLAGHQPKIQQINTPFETYSITSGGIKSPLKICKGIYQSHQIIREIAPDIIIGFGSYHSFPLLASGLLHQIPLILHEANAIPGKVNRLMSRYSLFTAVQFKEAIPLLNGKIKEAPLPLKADHLCPTLKPDEAILKLGLQLGRFTLLIFGGSQGAKGINQLIKTILPTLVNRFSPLQVIHITGHNEKETDTIKEMYRSSSIPHFVSPFHPDMTTIWQAADFAITRAGASTIREMIHFEVPSLFIPYPFATDNHQEKNAAFICKKVGGGITLNEDNLNPQLLIKLFEKLFNHKMATLRAMKQALRSFKKRTDKKSFAELILNQLEESGF
ncbi:UDP-N-acetylglucosamine--N-acetylmuramyl-(pentapeptide) pyrophosphoryl-undecaprenol N-acetylglucosamine transferase [Chlamydiales bacterium]|nr:UDP-N-acetylglucosamine--N-acetylmuramyl-(pentapeptide) pyrophosphoryl-undecaprenol N-acetylglucosamine transferase [Chlamydiales bacterium]